MISAVSKKEENIIVESVVFNYDEKEQLQILSDFKGSKKLLSIIKKKIKSLS